MADKQQNRAPNHTEAGPEIAPHGREKTLEEHRGRLEDEPAAAPLETDAESGGASAVSGLAAGEVPRDPAQPYLGIGTEQVAETDLSGKTGWLKWVIGALVLLALAYAAIQI